MAGAQNKRTTKSGNRPTTAVRKTAAATTRTTEVKTPYPVMAIWQDSDLTYVPRLQQLGARLLEKRQGSIVAIRPKTGEVLCMVSHTLEGNNINRAISATYPPGSTFKAAQLLTLWTEHTVDKDTKVKCHRGFMMGGTHVAVVPSSPLATTQAQSCNSWFITNFIKMIADYHQVQLHEAML